MTHEENRIAADDLRSHRELGKDLMKMESEKQKLALFDDLVDAAEQASKDIEVGRFSVMNQINLNDLVKRARAIK